MRRPFAALLLLAALTLAGCAGDPDDDPDNGDPSPTPTDTETPPSGILVTASVSAVGAYPLNPAFNPDRLTFVQGSTVELTFRNEDTNSLINHDWFVEGLNTGTEIISGGQSTTLTFTVDLEPGEYAFWCTVGDHRSRGMEGVMVVTEA